MLPCSVVIIAYIVHDELYYTYIATYDIAIGNQDARINVGALTVQYSYVGYVV